MIWWANYVLKNMFNKFQRIGIYTSVNTIPYYTIPYYTNLDEFDNIAPSESERRYVINAILMLFVRKIPEIL